MALFSGHSPADRGAAGSPGLRPVPTRADADACEARHADRNESTAAETGNRTLYRRTLPLTAGAPGAER